MNPLAVLLPDGRRLHLQHGPIDLIVEAWGEAREVAAGYRQAAMAFADVLPGLVKELPLLRAPLPQDAGHGPVARYQDLVDYVAMLTTIRDRMQALVKSGATLQQVVAARPTSEWDEKKGDPAGFLNRSYASLSAEARRP